MTDLGQPSRRLIDAGYLNFVLSGVKRSGIDVQQLLRRANVDAAVLTEDDAQLSQEAFARLISTLTRVTKDEFWLLCDRPIKLGTFNTMCRLIVQCRDLGSALRTGFRFYHRTADDFTVRLREDGSEACVWVTTTIDDPTRKRMVCGATLFFVYGMMCWLVGRRLPLNSVRYSFDEQPFNANLVPYYDAPMFFEQRSNELRFQSEILDLPIMPDEARLLHFIRSMPSALIVRYRDDSSIGERVSAILRRNLSKQISLEDVAARLGVSPQTLRRRLVDSDKRGFQELKDQVRCEAAVRLLRTTKLSLENIALHLGFSELSTFHRAFRRWTGLTPGSYRQADDQPDTAA